MVEWEKYKSDIVFDPKKLTEQELQQAVCAVNTLTNFFEKITELSILNSDTEIEYKARGLKMTLKSEFKRLIVLVARKIDQYFDISRVD